MGLEWNYIEGQTPINEEEKDGLKISSIALQKELDEMEQYNIEKAVKWTFGKRFSTDRILSEAFVKNLHKRMFGEVWNWAGKFRKSNKNIGIDWTQISIEVNKLLGDTTFWIENNTYEPQEIAIRCKHCLVSIHCFPNGNGRHSRLLADVMMESIFDQEPFTWGQTNLVKANETRKMYIKALQKADAGDISPLLDFANS